MSDSLVYIGKIISLEDIPNSDFISSATVVCGKGGKWKGVVTKTSYKEGDKCVVYLPDSLIPENEDMKFMASSNWRVKMRRFRGAPSEVLIMPCHQNTSFELGQDLTELFGVTKYQKPIPIGLQGDVEGEFPQFIPKTDEPNYQTNGDFIKDLIGKPYYISEKCDGSSTTAYKYKGKFGVCSRNWELKRDENNGYWKIALKYDLENTLPEGIALQWETCGPNIQLNKMGLKDISGFAFSAYDIENKEYLDLGKFELLCERIDFPRCRLIEIKKSFCDKNIHLLGEGKYENGNEREGVVVRSLENLGNKPISFKVINLNYDN